MKKIIAMLCAVVLLASLISCGPVDTTASDANLEEQQVEEQVEEQVDEQTETVAE